MIRNMWVGVLGGVIGLGMTGCASTHESHAPASEAEMMEMMQAYMEANQLDEHHAKLARSVGNWTVESKMWMYPGAEPERSTAQTRIESILDGHYVVEHFNGQMDFGGQSAPFSGLNIVGYDTMRQRWVNAWVDNFTTGIMYGEGTESADGKTVTYHAKMIDPMTGKPNTMKYETIDMGPNKIIFRMYEKGQDGKEFVHMESVYTRN